MQIVAGRRFRPKSPSCINPLLCLRTAEFAAGVYPAVTGCAEAPDEGGHEDNKMDLSDLPYMKFLIAFAIVFVLIIATFWLLRRFGGARLGNNAARGRQPRLAVIDAAAVDGRRRLVLIRRDNVEHLVMIGGPSDVVIEQNIVRAVPVASQREAPGVRTAGQPEQAPRAAEPVPAREIG